MGNHNSHDKSSVDGVKNNVPSGLGSRGGSRRGTLVLSRRESDADTHEGPPQTSLVPVEKLGKLLIHKAHKEEGFNGITEKVFVKYVFAKYPQLGSLLYKALMKWSGKSSHLTTHAYRIHVEKLLAKFDDADIVETYVRIFSGNDEECTPESIHSLLEISYQLSVDHYPGGPVICPYLQRTLSAIQLGCFKGKSSLALASVVRWLMDNCFRLILPVHRYCVHALTTSWRQTEQPISPSVISNSSTEELMSNSNATDSNTSLLPPSGMWLMAAVGGNNYTTKVKKPMDSTAWLSQSVCLLPSHWSLLYASREHGLGFNRFMHHVTAYRGPTVCVIRGEELLLGIISQTEWRESTAFWGDSNTVLLQLYPTFSVLCRGEKVVFLNSCIRGYPRGLLAGEDKARPIICIDEDFAKITYKGDTKSLSEIEVWGCGEASSRETQLEIKKWQIREAERQRQVKLSAADWIEHPDRYLLELAGRPQYNNSAS